MQIVRLVFLIHLNDKRTKTHNLTEYLKQKYIELSILVTDAN